MHLLQEGNQHKNHRLCSREEKSVGKVNIMTELTAVVLKCLGTTNKHHASTIRLTDHSTRQNIDNRFVLS